MIQYKIFQYAPLQSQHAIPLGILFHEPSIDHRVFRYTNDFSELETKYQDLDIAMIKKLLVGIKEQVESAEFLDIEDFTRFYLNDFHFGEMKWEEYGDLDGTIDRIYKDCFLR